MPSVIQMNSVREFEEKVDSLSAGDIYNFSKLDLDLSAQLQYGVRYLKSEGLSMSMWIGSNKADIEITCVNPKKSFSWSFVKQNNPEKKWNQYFHISKKSFLIVGSTENGISLRVKKDEALNPFFALFDQLQNLFNVGIKSIVVDEDIFDSSQTVRYVIAMLYDFGCVSLRIPAFAKEPTMYQSEQVVRLLNGVKIFKSLTVNVNISHRSMVYLERVWQIPNVIMTNASYHNQLPNAGYDTTYYMDECSVDVINEIVNALMITHKSNLITMTVHIKKLDIRHLENLLANFKHFTRNDQQRKFRELRYLEKMHILTNDGVHLRRSDGALMTMYLKTKSLISQEHTFIIHAEYPWNSPMINHIDKTIETYASKKETLKTLKSNLKVATNEEQKCFKKWHNEKDRAELLKAKRALHESKIGKVKIAFEMNDYQHQINHMDFLKEMCLATQARKDFGFFSYGANQN